MFGIASFAGTLGVKWLLGAGILAFIVGVFSLGIHNWRTDIYKAAESVRIAEAANESAQTLEDIKNSLALSKKEERLAREDIAKHKQANDELREKLPKLGDPCPSNCTVAWPPR